MSSGLADIFGLADLVDYAESISPPSVLHEIIYSQFIDLDFHIQNIPTISPLLFMKISFSIYARLFKKKFLTKIWHVLFAF